MSKHTHQRLLTTLVAAAAAAAAVAAGTLLAPGVALAQHPRDEPRPSPTKSPQPQPPRSPLPKPVDNPEQICGGAGWRVLDSADIKTPKRNMEDSLGRHVAGTTFLLWNGSTGENCVVTVKRGDRFSRAVEMSASLEIQNGKPVEDRGDFTRYAGPVKAYAAGKCIKWGGSIERQESLDNDPGKNGFEFCD